LLAAALAVTLVTQDKGKAGVSDGAVHYQPGQRPAAPDFTATSLSGATIKLSSYRGKTVVLNFWGSWCPPCRDEAPTLAVLAQQYGKQGVAFLGDDVGDTPANALAFTKSIGIGYPSINDPGYAVVQKFSQVAPVSDTPTTVVIDKTGHVVGMVLGKVSYGQLTTLLRDAAVTQ
jgi:thiol-disulfide isomerase/thioredoxin